MYRNRKVSIILPAYNERENIRACIEEFFLHPAVDEVIAVDNRSTDGTKAEIQHTHAKYVYEEVPGYGSALRRGMKEACGEILVTVEPDGTFSVKDLEKLLIYSEDFEIVLGTRTSRALIWSGAYMPFSVRIGNWAVAKLLEYLFNGPSLTDVGCTYKLIKRHAYEQTVGGFTVNGSYFSPEFIIRGLQAKMSCAEIPVHYGSRIGTSKITGNAWHAIVLGFVMIKFIISERIWPTWKPKKT
ncbi:glycosyltransferase family 2 protein [Candidatus Uhrbacteria bacterium]|nr:glycosyltransferase family 2 protein [Candidatus Uhrbacteria bacterium]